MPHLVFQTKFPRTQNAAELTFYGTLDQQTMEALQSTTFTALDTDPPTSNGRKPGFWRQQSFSSDVL